MSKPNASKIEREIRNRRKGGAQEDEFFPPK